MQSKTSIAIFASGAGTNASNLMEYFREGPLRVALLVCNKPGAGVIAIAEAHSVPVLMINRAGFYSEQSCLPELKSFGIEWIILAGFLWKIPSPLIKAYPGKMINIHPALLPKYGGQGMYGRHVHEAVIEAKERESGITVHFVDEVYDHGEIIQQATCEVHAGDTPLSLAVKIHELEQTHFPSIVERVIKAKS